MENIVTLVRILERGGVVACPTETWLGLLADARNGRAVERVASLKGRPTHLPIALLLPDASALTLVVNAKPHLHPRLVRDGKVGVRVPGPSPAAELTRAFGHAVTATSANLSGEPALRSVEELPESLAQGVDASVHGTSPGGAASTVVDTTTTPMTILRPGAIEIDPAAL
jgi:L-threonylcarbamoyladenylate synthase